jgi:hypothetical protein
MLFSLSLEMAGKRGQDWFTYSLYGLGQAGARFMSLLFIKNVAFFLWWDVFRLAP